MSTDIPGDGDLRFGPDDTLDFGGAAASQQAWEKCIPVVLPLISGRFTAITARALSAECALS